MASRIKGITVEIGGDTTKLTDALKDVNKEISSTQAQLKDAITGMGKEGVYFIQLNSLYVIQMYTERQRLRHWEGRTMETKNGFQRRNGWKMVLTFF